MTLLKNNFSSEEDSEEISSSEDEDIALAREIMAGKSLLYRENDMNQIPNDLPPLRNSGEQKIKFGKCKSLVYAHTVPCHMWICSQSIDSDFYFKIN